jgi:hypothetical protein
MRYGVVFPQTEFGNDVQAVKDYAQATIQEAVDGAVGAGAKSRREQGRSRAVSRPG